MGAAEDADDPRSLLRLAMDAHRGGQLEQADAAYANFLDRFPDHGQALRLRGVLARERGDLALSIRLLRRGVAHDTPQADAADELGLSYLAAGYLHLAESALRRAHSRAPGSTRATANLGAVLQHRGHLNEAIALYREVLAREPRDLEVRCNLATCLVDAGRGEEALAECDRAKTPEAPLVLSTRGTVLTALGSYAEAADVLEQALQQNPRDDMALINLGHALQMAGDAGRAEEVLQRAVWTNPDNARAVADLAHMLAARGETGPSIGLCEAFLARHPGERLVVPALAWALQDAGRTEEAQALLGLETLVQVLDPEPPPGCGDRAAFAAALARTIMQDPSLLAGPLSKSTRGGWQTGELDLGSPALAGFGQLLRSAVEGVIAGLRQGEWREHPVMACATARWTLRAWGTVLDPGGYQEPHMHPLGWLSGVYYLQVPEAMQVAEAEAGRIEFGRPPERLLSTGRAPGENPHRPLRTIEPLPGRLVIFPSWLYHRTKPFGGDSPRVSIAFDVMPVWVDA